MLLFFYDLDVWINIQCTSLFFTGDYRAVRKTTNHSSYETTANYIVRSEEAYLKGRKKINNDTPICDRCFISFPEQWTPPCSCNSILSSGQNWSRPPVQFYHLNTGHFHIWDSDSFASKKNSFVIIDFHHSHGSTETLGLIIPVQTSLLH